MVLGSGWGISSLGSRSDTIEDSDAMVGELGAVDGVGVACGGVGWSGICGSR